MFHIESGVRRYCRSYPELFDTALGSELITQSGKRYLDFLSGCGSLNYGHNNPNIKSLLLEYIQRDGLALGLDLETCAKADFLNQFEEKILRPRYLEYKVQFPGPTGTNAVEAAIKLARKVTDRTNVVAFTNAFHGCTLGSLSLTGSAHHRSTSLPLLNQVTRWPFDGYFGSGADTATMLEQIVNDPSGGVDNPAAIIVELVQGEGGLNVASMEWLQALRHIATQLGTLLIVDDIQAGCGRTGTFFSFEGYGVEPDIVVLGKSISGFGLPMSLLLMRPGLDLWRPGEHNGTFRGNSHAFVTATAVLQQYWSDDRFEIEVAEKAKYLKAELNKISERFQLNVKGRGLFLGLEIGIGVAATEVQKHCFANSLIVECCGPHNSVLKLLPPLTVLMAEIEEACSIIEMSIEAALGGKPLENGAG